MDLAIMAMCLRHDETTATSGGKFPAQPIEPIMTNQKPTREDAEATAIAAFGFVASDPQLMGRFLAITGIDASRIRKAASEPGFLAGVLDFILAHEPTLMRFVEEDGRDPGAVLAARRMLPNGDDRYEAST